jgi:uncharacterized membrane protein
MKPKMDKEINDLMHKNPDNWKAGIFYFNPTDPRILVPKKNPIMGWTLNFASPYSYISLAAIILVLVTITLIGS